MTEGWVSSEYVKPETRWNKAISLLNASPQEESNIRKPDLESAIIRDLYPQ
jgi:hypothetical protein